jgi:hypothetical protein
MVSLPLLVSNAAHGHSVNAWFSIGVGSLLLATLWFRYFKGQRRLRPSPSVLVGITAICFVLIGVGIWELFR